MPRPAPPRPTAGSPPAPRTILFQCAGSYVSGMEIIELAIIRGLAARGYRVHVLVNGWNDGDFVGRLDEAGIPHTTAFTGKITVRRPSWMFDTLRHLPAARRTARRLVRDLRPDVVVACNRDVVVLLAGVFGSAPVVYHVHEALSRAWTGRVARVADRFFTVSQFIHDLIVANGVAPNRVSVVYNGVDKAATVERDRPSPPQIGICGQVGPWKGHDDLVDALAILGARGVPFGLRIYGRGGDEYVGALKGRIDAGGVADRVRWMGFERDIDAMYAGLDVLAVPSRSTDPFPTTVLEANARGLPVVGTLRGGIPEMISDGETGRLVPSEDPGALADALATLLADPDLRETMGASARVRVESEFLTHHMVDRFERALAGAA